MKLIIDACVFERPNQRGIARIFFNSLPLMCDSHADLSIELIFRHPAQIPYPRHSQIKAYDLSAIHLLRPWRFWKSRYRTVQDSFVQMIAGNNTNNIWFSTYFTTPPNGWRGKQVVFVYDMIYELFPELLPGSKKVIELKKNAIINADKVFCISETTASDLAHEYPSVQSKLHVVHLANDQFFTHLQGDKISTPISEKYLLYVGNRQHYKDFSTLLSAYAHWKNKSMIQLFIVGPELSAEEEVRITKLDLNSNVKVFAHADDRTLRDLYNQALAFIYPSLYEGFGIPILEAMACGCTVIASRIPSTLEIAQEAPIYFEPGNPSSLIEALDLLMADEKIKAQIAKGFAIASQYSWEKTAQSIYAGLLEMNG